MLIGKLPHREFAVVVLFKVGYDKKACVSEFDGDGSHEQDENDYSHDDDNQSEDGFQNFFNPWVHIPDEQDIIDEIPPDFVYDISMLRLLLHEKEDLSDSNPNVASAVE